MTNERPVCPTAKGLIDGTIVQTAWYEYLQADRNWALAEIERLRAGLEKMAADRSDGPTRRAAQAILDGASHEPNPARAANEQLCNCGEFCAVGLYGNPGNGGRCRRDVAGLSTRAAVKSGGAQ